MIAKAWVTLKEIDQFTIGSLWYDEAIAAEWSYVILNPTQTVDERFVHRGLRFALARDAQARAEICQTLFIVVLPTRHVCSRIIAHTVPYISIPCELNGVYPARTATMTSSGAHQWFVWKSEFYACLSGWVKIFNKGLQSLVHRLCCKIKSRIFRPVPEPNRLCGASCCR